MHAFHGHDPHENSQMVCYSIPVVICASEAPWKIRPLYGRHGVRLTCGIC